MASSYGPVYAALDNDATSMYVVDAINHREYAFAFDRSGQASPARVTAPLRQRGEQAIRGTVELLADFYGYPAKTAQ